MKKVMLAAVVVVAVAAPGASAAPAQKVIVCHNTGSAKNPVVTIDVAVAGAVNGHTGPGHHQAWGDGTGEGCDSAGGAE